MSFHRPMDVYDTFRYNNINQDKFTANFSPDFYNEYLTHFPEQCYVTDSYDRIEGYMIGKDEGSRDEYHVHVSAVTVAPEYRRLRVSQRLMGQLENVGNTFGCKFCDLFVREHNDGANAFYQKLEYVIFRTVKDYYVGQEAAYDRRKPLAADPDKQSVANAGKTIKLWVDYEF